MHIVSIAVVGKKNNPLYIYCENPNKKENFEYIIHTSLDFFEENKISNDQKNLNEEKPFYVGLLFPIESYRVKKNKKYQANHRNEKKIKQNFRNTIKHNFFHLSFGNGRAFCSDLYVGKK
ncbi:hypothetical protein M0813_23509 [Anaeramoeba flamelloides]|uniref:Trafficking protein particle complex subunit 2-like protein n=1 Tax=Anaeramoeba flamelloides TaxID=1746091 RepID=A0ABQ8Y930_9EUKA|nr:hypothetical protein M0813_23509 [Anaeramoeba flamelloides]